MNAVDAWTKLTLNHAMSYSSRFRPPLPRLAFRLGFTGHRRGPRLQLTDDGLGAVMLNVLQAIGDGLRDCKLDGWSYDPSPLPDLRMLNAAATGADTIAAQAAHRAGYVLECVLPFTREEYLDDFPAPQDRMACEQLLDHEQTVSVFSLAMKRGKAIDWRGYRAAGEVIVGNCDLLLAVWDGQDTGQLGGTEDVIRMALEREVPVVAIGAHSGQPMRFLSEDTVGREIDGTAIRALVTQLATPPSAAAHGRAAGGKAARKRYFTEDQRGGADRLGRLLPWHNSARALALFARLFSGRIPHLAQPDASLPPGAAAGVPRAGSSITAHFAAADAISTRMGYVYRSSFTILYLLSALAVLTGLLGIFQNEDMVLKAWLVLSELVVLAVIILLFATGRRQRWHYRWLDSRRISEVLRTAEAAAPLAGGGQRGGGAAAATDWTEWYVRAVLRENRLPASVTATPAYLHAEIRRYVSGLLDGQIRYHWLTVRNMARLHKGLDHLGMGLLLASAGVGAAYVAAVFLDLAFTHHHPGFFADRFKPFVTYAAAGFPALGAALYGIRAHGDYEATAERSADTLRELLDVRRSLLLLAARAEPGFVEVRAELAWAAEVMQSDLTLWRSLYRNRPLTMLA